MELDMDNKEWQQALQIVNYTRRSLFLTGKAGTGKSTFLRYVAKNTKKKHVILAPTGLAAINAGGSTIHSFFHLPLHPLLPNDTRYSRRNIRETLKYTKDRCKLLQEVELIIIDEISMVRADIIDFIDKVLRIYCKNMREPFGGKQLLLVGDVYQLEPVVTADERQLLQPFYPSAYFFHAHVFTDFKLVSIELRKVYRQKDDSFIAILDRIRNNTPRREDMEMLNARVGASVAVQDNELVITLATRRDTVEFINEQRLEKIEGRPTIFHGTIVDQFPLSSLPSPMELSVKPGAQVIFVRNDKEKRWVNGTLGVINCIDEEQGIITVTTEDGMEYDVERDVWENVRYTFNEKEQKIDEELLGTYKQFPLRLAWAITVHKSQGLTFRKVNIDFTGGAFAGGQTYVALSRCTSLDGICLKSPLRPSDVFVRTEVMQFARHYNDNALINKALTDSRADREYREAVAAFDRQDFDAFLDNFFRAIHSRYDIEQPLAKRYIRRKLAVITKLKAENEELKASLKTSKSQDFKISKPQNPKTSKPQDLKTLKEENKRLKEEAAKQRETLKRLAVEYVLLGKECEREHMNEAAIRNYEKALTLYPEANEAKQRIEKLRGKKKV